MTLIVQILTLILAHFLAIVQLTGIIGGLIIASGLIKNNRIKALINDAIAFADQYEKTQLALGNAKPTGAVLKQMAIDYVQERFPSVDVALLDKDVEAAINLFNAKNALLPKPLKGVQFFPGAQLQPICAKSFTVAETEEA